MCPRADRAQVLLTNLNTGRDFRGNRRSKITEELVFKQHSSSYAVLFELRSLYSMRIMVSFGCLQSIVYYNIAYSLGTRASLNVRAVYCVLRKARFNELALALCLQRAQKLRSYKSIYIYVVYINTYSRVYIRSIYTLKYRPFLNPCIYAYYSSQSFSR